MKILFEIQSYNIKEYIKCFDEIPLSLVQSNSFSLQKKGEKSGWKKWDQRQRNRDEKI